MRIIWIVNTIFPYPAEQLNYDKSIYGGWLNGLATNLILNSEIELCIVSTYDGKKLFHCVDSRIEYYLLPGGSAIKYNSKLNNYAKIIIQNFKPDIVHIHGTEFSHSLSFINEIKDENIKIITSIQGLVSVYAKNYLAGIRIKDIIKNNTLRNFIKRDGIINSQKNFELRGKYEKEIIKRSNVILGRTTWDYANTKAINSDEKYFYCGEILRKSFYKDSWNKNNIEKYSLFSSQGNYPVKGLHFLLKTVEILKIDYPNVKLYIGGQNIINTDSLKNKIKLTGYGRYIKRLIKAYKIEDNVFFTGPLDEERMRDRLLKTNVFVLPSVIENSSNSLCEAMILGVPCVATNTGGTMDMLEHKKEGFLYPYNEPAICAKYISDYFKDDSLCVEMGINSKNRALNRHDPKKIIDDLIKIYKTLIYKNIYLNNTNND